jgi:hypothetical protein
VRLPAEENPVSRLAVRSVGKANPPTRSETRAPTIVARMASGRPPPNTPRVSARKPVTVHEVRTNATLVTTTFCLANNDVWTRLDSALSGTASAANQAPAATAVQSSRKRRNAAKAASGAARTDVSITKAAELRIASPK